MEKLIKNIRSSPLKSVQKSAKLDSVGTTTQTNGLVKKLLDLQIQLAELENEHKELKENNDFLCTERLVLEESMRELEQQVKFLKANKQANECMIAEMDQRLSEYRQAEKQGQAASLDGRSRSLDAGVNSDAIRQENQSLQEQLTKTQISLQSLEKKYLDSQAAQESLKSQIEKLRNEKLELSRVLAELKVENTQAANKKKEELKTLREQLAEKEDINQKLMARYLRHRQVWEDNQERAIFEIQKLDEAIDNVIATLKANSDKIGHIPAIQLLLQQLTNEETNSIQ